MQRSAKPYPRRRNRAAKVDGHDSRLDLTEKRPEDIDESGIVRRRRQACMELERLKSVADRVAQREVIVFRGIEDWGPIRGLTKHRGRHD